MEKLSWIFFTLLFTSCWSIVEENDKKIGEVNGYVPVYGTKETTEITFQPSRAIQNPGKIYIYGQYLLINEVNRGIHVYDNSNKAEPKPLKFIEIIGNSDMSVRNGILYADHMGNLAAIETTDMVSGKVVGSLEIDSWLLGVPAPSGHYFECIDHDKGLVVDWKLQKLNNPDCYAF